MDPLTSKGTPRHLVVWLGLGVAAVGWLVGCSSRFGDGTPTDPPSDLARVPDAQPRIEPFVQNGANKPYQVMGRSYQPVAVDMPFSERGLASWYGTGFHGQRTSTGEVYDMYAMSAAHPTMPLPSYARVRNPANGREVIVRINDRGPFHPGRIIDLSYTAALKLDLLRSVAQVEVRRITWDEIRRNSDITRDVRNDTLPMMGAAGAMPPAAPRRTGPPFPSASANASAYANGNNSYGQTGSGAYSNNAGYDNAYKNNLGYADNYTPNSFAPNNPYTPDFSSGSLRRSGYWVQVGAFSQHDSALGMQRRVTANQSWVASSLSIFNENGWYRLQTGPYATMAQAQQAAQRLRETLQLEPLVMEKR